LSTLSFMALARAASDVIRSSNSSSSLAAAASPAGAGAASRGSS
jgi:hypothetical protein